MWEEKQMSPMKVQNGATKMKVDAIEGDEEFDDVVEVVFKDRLSEEDMGVILEAGVRSAVRSMKMRMMWMGVLVRAG